MIHIFQNFIVLFLLIQGNLASIPDAVTNNFIESLVNGETIWLGGFRLEDGKNVWGWTDGSAWGYTNWKSGEPNDSSGTEDFAMMNYGTHPKGSWNDGKIVENYGFICQSKDLSKFNELRNIISILDFRFPMDQSFLPQY